MSGAGFDSSASSEEVVKSTRSAMRAMSRYSSSSSFLAEEATAIRTPASRTHRNRSGTAENGRTSGRYAVLKRLPRHSSISLPWSRCSSADRKTGMSLSPPLPIWPLTCSKLTSWPNLTIASCHASAWRSTESRSVPSRSKIAAFGNSKSSMVGARESSHNGRQKERRTLQRVPNDRHGLQWWLPEMEIVGIELADFRKPPPAFDHQRSALKFQRARGAEPL